MMAAAPYLPLELIGEQPHRPINQFVLHQVKESPVYNEIFTAMRRSLGSVVMLKYGQSSRNNDATFSALECAHDSPAGIRFLRETMPNYLTGVREGCLRPQCTFHARGRFLPSIGWYKHGEGSPMATFFFSDVKPPPMWGHVLTTFQLPTLPSTRTQFLCMVRAADDLSPTHAPAHNFCVLRAALVKPADIPQPTDFVVGFLNGPVPHARDLPITMIGPSFGLPTNLRDYTRMLRLPVYDDILAMMNTLGGDKRAAVTQLVMASYSMHNGRFHMQRDAVSSLAWKTTHEHLKAYAHATPRILRQVSFTDGAAPLCQPSIAMQSDQLTVPPLTLFLTSRVIPFHWSSATAAAAQTPPPPAGVQLVCLCMLDDLPTQTAGYFEFLRTFAHAYDIPDLCDVCHRLTDTHLHCGRCRGGNYCSKACQTADWPRHKLVCGLPPPDPNAPEVD